MKIAKVPYNLPVLKKGSWASLWHLACHAPILTAEEEILLAQQYLHDNNKLAGEKLILAHLRLVIRIAAKLAWNNLAMADVIQEGITGLLKATQRFNPALGVRLSAFATYYIKSEIYNFIINNWSMVQIAKNKNQRKLFFNLQRLCSSLEGEEDKNRLIAQRLGMKVHEVTSMRRRLQGHDTELTEEFIPGEHSAYVKQDNPEDLILAADWRAKLALTLKSSLQSLDKRSEEIVAARLLSEKPLSLKVLSARYNISMERVRQIEKKALCTLKGNVQAQGYGEADGT